MLSLKSELFKIHELPKNEYTKIVGGVQYSARTNHATGGANTYDCRDTPDDQWEDSSKDADSQPQMTLG